MLMLVLLFFAILAVVGIWALSFLFIIGYLKTRKEPLLTSKPSVCVIVPCKEKGENLSKNITAFCHQQYPHYRLLFILDSSTDSAFPVVTEAIRGVPHASLEFSAMVPNTSGKISALLTGIAKAGDAEILVFADSDIRPHPVWLADLVAPLADEHVGATTGFRWFVPTNLTTALISTWNLSTVSGMFYQITTFAWGGSMAIKASLFHRLGIAGRWKEGLSDDLILTHAVKKAGYQLRFVPQCVVESPAEPQLRKFIRWGSQQLTWMRWYSPAAWGVYYVGILLVTAMLIIEAVLYCLGNVWFGLLLGLTVGGEMIYGWVGVMTFQRLMRYPPETFRYKAWFGVLAPVAFLLYAYNAVVSSVKREISWCGKTYRKRDLADLKHKQSSP